MELALTSHMGLGQLKATLMVLTQLSQIKVAIIIHMELCIKPLVQDKSGEKTKCGTVSSKHQEHEHAAAEVASHDVDQMYWVDSTN